MVQKTCSTRRLHVKELLFAWTDEKCIFALTFQQSDLFSDCVESSSCVAKEECTFEAEEGTN